MDGFPLLITSDWMAVPERHLSGRMEFLPDLGVYRFEECSHCGKPVRDHIWFVLVAETQVSDCSEANR